MSVNIIFDILILAYQRYFVLQGGFLKPFMRNGGGGGGGDSKKELNERESRQFCLCIDIY